MSPGRENRKETIYIYAFPDAFIRSDQQCILSIGRVFPFELQEHPHLFLFFCSPQLRMSFIVFSTEGRILMKLTEDR